MKIIVRVDDTKMQIAMRIRKFSIAKSITESTVQVTLRRIIHHNTATATTQHVSAVSRDERVLVGSM